MALVPAPDGTPLATDLCLPDGPGPHPAVLVRTPYDRRRHHAELRGWARRGFAAVAQDVRGRYGSAGRWRPYGPEADDGAATVRWIRERPWSDGTLVACGASYAAHCALVTALAADPAGRADAVLAAVPALGLAETAREPSGCERLLARAGWWAAHGDRRDGDEEALARVLARDPGLLEHLPLTDLPRRLGRELPTWPELWRARPAPLPAAAGAVPLLAVGGSHDPFAADLLRLWRHWGGPARLLLGPWGHGLTADPGPDATDAHRTPLGELYAAWARAALAGRLAPGRAGAVALGGSGRWLPAAALARPGTPYRFTADRAGTGTDGTDGTGGELRLLRGREFTADPLRPVRSDDLAVPATGVPDRCLLLTAPLPRSLDLLGEAEVRLSAAADTADADWAARLVALAPDGRAAPLAAGIERCRAAPGRTTAIRVPLGVLARRLPAGTRLRLEIAGHHFPAHARNPHTGEDPVTATAPRPSRRTVLTGSALLLPVSTSHPSADPLRETRR
ncbi:CocE/NonD family hydrolase [Streptomyces sp. TRM 70361]|uniref:CocE/NonD family hydrolase n=1 Tax=Streptomyces sp. TRM 70361 TaxID=3116553 RepID=UPI002E7AB22E|nr:CocE/NonD family hydrolase [Streptomyces sp. TRM 70361]MEE1941052.1 CocE/NonD family hydrolase [Streptomyces sp. TRM 70361]